MVVNVVSLDTIPVNIVRYDTYSLRAHCSLVNKVRLETSISRYRPRAHYLQEDMIHAYTIYKLTSSELTLFAGIK